MKILVAFGTANTGLDIDDFTIVASDREGVVLYSQAGPHDAGDAVWTESASGRGKYWLDLPGINEHGDIFIYDTATGLPDPTIWYEGKLVPDVDAAVSNIVKTTSAWFASAETFAAASNIVKLCTYESDSGNPSMSAGGTITLKAWKFDGSEEDITLGTFTDAGWVADGGAPANVAPGWGFKVGVSGDSSTWAGYFLMIYTALDVHKAALWDWRNSTGNPLPSGSEVLVTSSRYYRNTFAGGGSAFHDVWPVPPDQLAVYMAPPFWEYDRGGTGRDAWMRLQRAEQRLDLLACPALDETDPDPLTIAASGDLTMANGALYDQPDATIRQTLYSCTAGVWSKDGFAAPPSQLPGLTLYLEGITGDIAAQTLTLTPTAGGVGLGRNIVLNIPPIPQGYYIECPFDQYGWPVTMEGAYLVQPTAPSSLTVADMISGGIATESSTGAIEAAVLTGGGGGGSLPVGSGRDPVTLIIVDDDNNPVADCEVWVSSDEDGTTVVAGTLRTNDAGQITFRLESGTQYYVWRGKAGVNFVNPVLITAVAD